MQQSFYNDLRKNNHSAKSNRSRVIQSARSSSNKPILINYEKRNKLKSLLIQKFTKKYNLKVNEPAIDEEVTKFLFKETLTDNDLKQLDKKISDILGKKNLLKNIENSTKNEEMYSEYDMEMNEIKGKQRLNTALERKSGDEMSVRSGLSGASKLSKVKNHKKDLTEEELECLSIYSNYKEPVERFEFPNEKDEWNAINKYNQIVFEQDKIKERLLDREIKNRTKEDLDNQIKQKMILMNEERMKNKEYDKITIDHVKVLNKMEEDRIRDKRNKMLREKENRDVQMLDEKKRKRIEELKNKKYEKELCKIFIIISNLYKR